MLYRLSDIVRQVRIAIDQNEQDTFLSDNADEDTLGLDTIIESKVPEAARIVVSVAPVQMLDGGYHFGNSIAWQKNNSGWLHLPEDFLRLIVFRMSDWERPVSRAISNADPAYNLQFSRCKGLRGNPQNPVVAVTLRGEGLILEFWSCHTNQAKIVQAAYHPIPQVQNNAIEIPEQCYRAFIYALSALTMETLGEPQLAERFSTLSTQLLSN
ncbi:MAG: hypothetical protein HDT09_02265 [Bacteroidales bacterium]|nr:hypothetical protein [Bacteroidales bacterium]